MCSFMFTNYEIAQMKRAAKEMQRSSNCKHAEALDFIANSKGFQSWALLQKNNAHRIATSAEVQAAHVWFASQFLRAESRYYTPVVSPRHMLAERFGDIKEVEIVAEQLAHRGYWTSSALVELDKKVAHPYKKRRIAGRFAPCMVLGVRESSQDLHLVVPVVRTVPPKTFLEERQGYAGQLVFRCPICGGIHFHGGGAMRFGSGNGHRTPHCDNGRYREYGFVLIEQKTDKLVGHLRKSLREDCFLPE